jgi:hypothetical protein
MIDAHHKTVLSAILDDLRCHEGVGQQSPEHRHDSRVVNSGDDDYGIRTLLDEGP